MTILLPICERFPELEECDYEIDVPPLPPTVPAAPGTPILPETA